MEEKSGKINKKKRHLRQDRTKGVMGVTEEITDIARRNALRIGKNVITGGYGIIIKQFALKKKKV